MRAQADALRKFRSFYVGSRRESKGLSLPPDLTLVVNSGGTKGRVAELAFKAFGHAPAFFHRLQGLHPVLVHAHFGIDATLALPLARFLSIPLVVTFHGYDATITDEAARSSFFSHRRYPARRQALQREGRLFIAVSSFIRDKLLAQGFPPQRIVVHYIGVDVEFFRADASISREPIVLFVGRLVEKKGCAHLIRAMTTVQQAVPSARLVIIGDGPLRQDLERLAQGSLQDFEFLGTQPPEVVRAWMNKVKVFSVPSVTAASGDAEGFGMVFAEAQAMGLPIASFASGGIPEAVAHGETGLLSPERNEQELATAIRQLLTDELLWNRLSEAGVARARRLFDLRAQAALLEDLYTRVLSERSS